MNQLPFEKIKRTVLKRLDFETDQKYGLDPEKRTIPDLLQYGIISVNKPKGPTSHQTSSYVQKILKIKKSGHSGTLDPNVTGVLPVALGRATRIVQALLPSGKEYVCLMHVHKPFSEESLHKVIKNFIGRIKQKPPIKSSVKRVERFRTIYYIEILDVEGQDVLFRVGCQAGTYIRKLCHDMGVELGSGAHMSELIRTKAGPFSDKEMYTLQELIDAFWYYENEKIEKYVRTIIKPIEYAVTHLPHVWVLDSAVNSICHGNDLKVPGVVQVMSDIQVGETVAIMTMKNELVALGEAKLISKDMLKERGLAVKTNKVFMDPTTYPRISLL
jgi:H/ACA ribonucleoprotein complex subunit 4